MIDHFFSMILNLFQWWLIFSMIFIFSQWFSIYFNDGSFTQWFLNYSNDTLFFQWILTYFNDFAPSMITASSVMRINATAHFINSNTKNVFKVLIFFLHSRSSKAQNYFSKRAHVSSIRYSVTKTADGELFSEFFYRRALRSPLTAKNFFHYSALAGTMA